MQFPLQYPPTPENAAKHAQLAVDAARDVERITLDFSPQSLTDIDRIVGRFHSDGLRPEQIGSTVFSLGCYVGEIFVRHHGGVWKMPAETTLPNELKDLNNMMVVELPDGDVWNPISKTFQLLENGQGDGVAYFYHIAIMKDG